MKCDWAEPPCKDQGLYHVKRNGEKLQFDFCALHLKDFAEAEVLEQRRLEGER